MSSDLHDERLATPTDFSSEVFAFNNRSIFDELIELRVQGISLMVAYRMVLGESYNDNMASARLYAIEMNPYYRRTLKHKIDTTPFTDFWSPKTAVHELLSLVRDKWCKETVRLAAVKELNVIANITIIDESGKTKAGRKLSDFYADEGVKAEVQVDESDMPSDGPHTTH